MNKFIKTIDPPKNVTISFDSPNQFIGMVVNKTNTVSVCVGVEKYTRKDGENTEVLIWDCEFRSTGEMKKKKTSANFRVSDLPSTRNAFNMTKINEYINEDYS